MEVFVVGASHATMPVDLRERIAVGANQVQDTLSSLLDGLSQAVLLSTCNRTEVYTMDSGHRTANLDAAVDFLCGRTGLSRDEARGYLYVHTGEQAVRHLFRVASGLDSMVIGEYEVLGQVRQALENAGQVHRLNLPLLNLFHHAIGTGRRVRSETRLSRNALSVSSVAVDLAIKTVGDMSRCQMLVVGAGEAGKLVAKAARARGASRITVTNRSQERAAALAESLNADMVPFHQFRETLREADVAIVCTGAPHIIVDRQVVKEAMGTRPDRPLIVVDISVPRNVDTEVKQVPNVFLYDIDDLTQIAHMNEELRKSEIGKAMEIVDAEVCRYMTWFESMRAKPTVSALVQKAEAIRQRQIKMTLRKMPHLTDEERESLESMTRAILKKVLHDPIQCLKRDCVKCARRVCHDNDIHVQVVSELFRLNSEVSG